MPYDTSWREDLRTFALATKEHWKEIVGGSAVFILIGVFASMGLNVPPLISGIAALCLAIALSAFLCWRDEHAKTRSINRRAILYKIRDLIVETQNALPDAKYDSFGALLKYSEELCSEQDVAWVCNQLKAGNHDHPFGRLEPTCDNALSGQWLVFLQEARASSRNIRIVRSAVSFAGSYWSGRESYLKGRERYAESERSDPGLVIDGRRISLLTPIEIEEVDSPEKTREAATVKLSQYLRVGNSFLNKCRNHTEIDEAAVKTWANDAEYLVRLAAGEVWQVKFLDISGVPPASPPFVLDERVRAR